MTQRPVQLEYARRGLRTASDPWGVALLVTCCLGASWLTWYVISESNYDPSGREGFLEDRELVFWVTMVPGTACGLVLAGIGLYLRRLLRRRRR